MKTKIEGVIASVEELEAALSEPSDALVEEVAGWDDGLMVLGAGGKMGPTLCRMAASAFRRAGKNHEVIAVSRFSNPIEKEKLEAAGVRTISADLMDPEAVRALPACNNVIFAAGRKFGSTGGEALTWAMNAYLPGLVAERFKDSRIAAFSSGNVYPLVPVGSGGCSEEHPVGPVGEYAQSVLGRERIFEHFSRANGTPVTLIRLNYAVELRYGVLVDIATAIQAGDPVDVTMGHVNVVWQRDANEYAIRSLALASSPPAILNLTGPETVSVRWAAEQIAARMGKEVAFTGEESPTALLNNAALCHGRFGYPTTSLAQMIELVADWIKRGGETHGKPTHFQARDGKF